MSARSIRRSGVASRRRAIISATKSTRSRLRDAHRTRSTELRQRRSEGEARALILGCGLRLETAAPRSDRRRACRGDRLDREDTRAHAKCAFPQGVALRPVRRARGARLRGLPWARSGGLGGSLCSGSAFCPTGGRRCSIRSARHELRHAEVFLADRWRLLGAIEAINGLILFGNRVNLKSLSPASSWLSAAGRHLSRLCARRLRGWLRSRAGRRCRSSR
jgi:hypothetical protein